MRILMLVNWKVSYCDSPPPDKQPPDYFLKSEDYWFYRYFTEKPDVDVIDIHSFSWLENFEKNKLHFYIVQALRAIPKLHRYDLIVSHGMQSGVVISFWRRLFKGKAKHVVFDIGSFASAPENGFSLKLMRFVSKSIDWVIYHTSSQMDYYQRIFPWIVSKCTFIRFGVDLVFFGPADFDKSENQDTYILCLGYAKRDWDTVIKAYQKLDTDIKLRLVGRVTQAYEGIDGVEQLPFIPINDVIRQIRNAKFCVLPLENHNYSYGQMTLMQQMALGKCVVAANVLSLRDYISDGETAVCYAPCDVNDLYSKMKELIFNPSLVKTIERNAPQYLSEHCNVKLANHITVAAGAVVVHSFTEKGITIGGIPAQKIK